MKSGSEVCVTVTLLDGLVLARSPFHHSMNYRSVVVIGHPKVRTVSLYTCLPCHKGAHDSTRYLQHSMIDLLHFLLPAVFITQQECILTPCKLPDGLCNSAPGVVCAYMHCLQGCSLETLGHGCRLDTSTVQAESLI